MSQIINSLLANETLVRASYPALQQAKKTLLVS
jgi:hypothetical protein